MLVVMVAKVTDLIRDYSYLVIYRCWLQWLEGLQGKYVWNLAI